MIGKILLIIAILLAVLIAVVPFQFGWAIGFLISQGYVLVGIAVVVAIGIWIRHKREEK